MRNPFLRSLRNALRGIKSVWGSERNFKVQIVAGLIVILAGWLVDLTHTEWAFIIIAITLVLVSEVVNTALEKTLNHVEPNHHPSIAAIKDMAAAAVLISSLGAAIIGVAVFWNYLF